LKHGEHPFVKRLLLSQDAPLRLLFEGMFELLMGQGARSISSAVLQSGVCGIFPAAKNVAFDP
jgi:hypothetical protein